MRLLPPYVSWNGFLRTLDLLQSGLLDDVAAGFRSLPASTASQMTQALRFLGLVTAGGGATADLRLIVQHPAARTEVVQRLLRRSYPDVFEAVSGLPSIRALEAFIAGTGLRPATQRRAVLFFLNAASYGGLPIDAAGTAQLNEGASLSNDSQPPSISTKTALSIALASGGTIQIAGEFDPFRLDKEDREFVFDLIDRMDAYREQRRQREKETTGTDEAPF